MMPNSGNATFTTTALAGESDAVLIVRNASIFTTRTRLWHTRTLAEKRKRKRRKGKTTITHTQKRERTCELWTLAFPHKKQDCQSHHLSIPWRCFPLSFVFLIDCFFFSFFSFFLSTFPHTTTATPRKTMSEERKDGAVATASEAPKPAEENKGIIPGSIRYTALLLSCFFAFGGYLVFDLCSALKDQMTAEFHLSDTQYSLFYVVYAWTNWFAKDTQIQTHTRKTLFFIFPFSQHNTTQPDGSFCWSTD